MANFYTTETKTLRVILGNPNPIPITVTLTRGLAKAAAPYDWQKPPKTDTVTVPASGQSAPLDFSISFLDVPPGKYWGWAEVWDAATGELLGSFITEDTYIFAEAVTVVNIVWV